MTALATRPDRARLAQASWPQREPRASLRPASAVLPHVPHHEPRGEAMQRVADEIEILLERAPTIATEPLARALAEFQRTCPRAHGELMRISSFARLWQALDCGTRFGGAFWR